jgi:hypothetical protein
MVLRGERLRIVMRRGRKRLIREEREGWGRDKLRMERGR